jgi:predicted oxidoreductase
VLDDGGRELGEPAWHESDVVQRFPDGRAWYVVDARALQERVRDRTVAELVAAARAAGGEVRPAEELPFALLPSPKLAEPPFLAVRVYAAVTHTIGGLRIDDQARVLDPEGAPVPALHAAGADAGGIFTGGYGSGLAAALVYGRTAAETALT